MRIRCPVVAGFLLLVIAATSFPQTNSRTVVLPESAAKELAHATYRPGIEHMDGSWMPADADVRTLESHLSQVENLRSRGEKDGSQIRNPERYYRQYVGIMAGKHRFIYVNAFCENPPPKYWKQHLVDVLDGGDCFWGTVYDTVSAEFSDLQVNGVG